MGFPMCVVHIRAAGPVFPVNHPPPIFGWGWASKHVWNNALESDTETEKGTKRQREAETSRLSQRLSVKQVIR